MAEEIYNTNSVDGTTARRAWFRALLRETCVLLPVMAALVLLTALRII